VKQVLRVHWYPRYVPVDAQRARTISEMNRLAASGVKVQPVELRGRTLASSFWGRRWCEHVESFSEYAARLAHGRACLRNGSVCHLSIEPGGVDAMVIGSALYQVSLRIRRLDSTAWTAIGTACAGRIDSLVELHQGQLSDDIAEVFTHRDSGLFPQPGEIVASCECGDATPLCKHAAAVLSGVGTRLDERPELLFLLRGVDETALVGGEPARSRDTVAAGGLEPDATNGAASSHAVDSKTTERTRPGGLESDARRRPDVDRLGDFIAPGQEDAHVSTADSSRRRPTPHTKRLCERGGWIRAHGRDGRRLARAVRLLGGRVRGSDPGHADDGAPLGKHARTSQPARRSLGSLAGAVPGEPTASGMISFARRRPGDRRDKVGIRNRGCCLRRRRRRADGVGSAGRRQHTS